MWQLSEGLALIRDIQEQVKPLGFHVCLAGGVLNKGFSEKDLDLVFLPLTNAEKPKLQGLASWFNANWGLSDDNLTDPEPCVALRYQASYQLQNGKRIDVFVV